MYDWDIYNAASKNGSECAKAIAMVTGDIERIIQTNDERRNNLTNALNGMSWHGSFPDIGDYMYYVADIWATGVQYGHRIEICDMVLSEDWKTNATKRIELLHDFAWNNVSVHLSGYDVTSIIGRTPVSTSTFIRQWTW